MVRISGVADGNQNGLLRTGIRKAVRINHCLDAGFSVGEDRLVPKPSFSIEPTPSNCLNKTKYRSTTTRKSILFRLRNESIEASVPRCCSQCVAQPRLPVFTSARIFGNAIACSGSRQDFRKLGKSKLLTSSATQLNAAIG